MMKRFALLFCCLIGVMASAVAQHKAEIHGVVTDSQTREKMAYVTVAVLNSSDSSIVNGGITNDEGEFEIKDLKFGKYTLQYSFVGYKNEYKDLEINKGHMNIGEMRMHATSSSLDEIRVVGAKQMMEYKLDKRVLNVDQNLVAAGGTASDVLEDVPSVEVDDEGNITLRGGSNVTLLIDGKPSDLYGSDVASVLSQIPASSIDKVEVITNPSARYNPEGMSGIINITLKEKGNRGWNGNVNIASGAAVNRFYPYENVGAALNWSNKKFGFTSSASLRYGTHGMLTDNLRFFKDANNKISDVMRTQRDGGTEDIGYNLSLGGEWYIDQLNTLSLNFNTHTHQSLSDYSTATNTNYLDPLSERNNKDVSDGDGIGIHNNFGLTYEKKFKQDSEQLLYASATWNWGKHDRKTLDSVTYTNPAYTSYLRGDTNLSNHNHAVVDVHYIQPIGENQKLEVGYNLNYSAAKSKYEYSYDGVLDDNTSYEFNRSEAIHALYFTYGLQVGKNLSAQAGLRGEVVKSDFYQDLYNGKRNEFNKDYNSFYPTLHLSYQINQMNSVQLSYSRRIKRPNPWNMMPNVDLTNKEYVRFGNPDIDPEYTDAYELGYSLLLNKTTIYTSLYYREIGDAISHFEFLWDAENAEKYGFGWAWDVAGSEAATGRTAQTFMNISKSRNYGLELIVDRDITDWWKANLSMNFFGSYQDGKSLGYEEISSFNYNAKLNTTFSLPNKWTIQLSGRYFAPRKTIQGKMNYRYDVDLAVKKSVLHNHGTIGFNFRDIFDSRGGRGYAFTEDYISFNRRHPFSRSIRLSFTYNFGAGSHNHEKGVHKHDHNHNDGGSSSDNDNDEE